MARRRGQRKGYVYEKSGSWVLQWREDVRSAGGTIDRHKFARVIAPAKGAGAVSKRQAQRIAWEDVLAKLDTASLRPQSLATVADFVKAKFEPEVVWSLKATGGQPHYKYLLEKHVLPAIGALRLRDVTLAHIQKLIAQRYPKYSVQTLVHIRNCVSAVFRHAKACQWYAGDLPTEGLRLPEMRRKERRALGREQAAAIITALRSPYRELAFLLATTGLRIGEACGLRWKRVNFELGTLEIRESYIKGKWSTTKNENSVRLLPLPAAVAPLLARLKQRAHLVGPNDPVFITTHGNPCDAATTAEKFLKPVARELGMPWVSWHSLRHTAATFADQAGLSVAERKRILGHGTDRMAMHYSHADLEKTRSKMDGIAADIAACFGEGERVQ